MKSFLYQILEPQKMLPNVKSVMSKTNSLDSTCSSSSNYKSNDNVTGNEDLKRDIVKCGYLRKYKTMKKKFFVLRAGSESGPARLEYYDNEKRMKSNPKRSIVLQACFNINKKLDSKHKLAIALYTKDDCFSIVPETEAELEEWLTWLLALQQGHVTREGNITTIDKEAKPKPHFEFMWQISVKNKGLASKSPELLGPRRLCLTSTTLALVKMTEERESLDFPLMGIRRCGHSDCFFFMEVGRSSVTGAGEIWMQTEDTIIAQNMHEAILSAMKACRSQEELGPISRPRSASTSENGKSVSSRPGTVASNGSSVMGSSGSITGACGGSTNSVAGSYCADRSERNSLTSVGGNSLVQAIRDRCDSMPTRSRTVSEGHHDLGPRPFHFEMLRPHSTYGHMNAYSPPVVPNPLSPSSGGFSDSAGSSLSIDEFDSPSDFHHSRYLVHPSDGTLHTEPTITEENPDDYLSMAPIGLGENMTDSGVVVESRNSTAYSTASTISVASSVASTTSDYLQMEPNQIKTPKANSPPSFLNLVTSNLTLNSNIESKPTVQPTAAVNSPNTETEQTPLSRKESSGYVEMKSPQATNPATAGYFMMSPGFVGDDKDLITEPKEGYVRMNPATNVIPITAPICDSSSSIGSPHPDAAQYDGYLCMEVNSLSSSLPKSIPQSGNLSDYTEHMSSPRSNHSFQDTSLSCSPADVEFFPLEKVKSFFPPTDEDEDYIKPVRAYSIGSRPQLRKTHLANHLEQSRVRAYSFGSQLHSSRFRGRSSEGSAVSISGIPHVPGLDWELGVPKNLDSKVSKKSSSAPILPNSTNLTPSNSIPAGPNGGSRVPFHNKLPVSRSSDTRRDDLMEISYDSTSSHSRPVGSQENRRLSIGSIRQRTSNRSSSSALAAALNSHNQLVKNATKEGTKSQQVTEQTPQLLDGLHIVNQRNAASNNISEATKNPIVYSQNPNDYFEMSFGKASSNNTPSALYVENVEKVTAEVGSLNVAGEYVNLDLRKATWQLKDTQCAAKKLPINEPPPKEASLATAVEIPSKSPTHGYVNCTPDQKSVSIMTGNPESRKSGQFSEYFVMNFNTNSNIEKLNPCGTDSNHSVIWKTPSPVPVNGKKSEESDYCPVSSCGDIAPMASVFNKKGPTSNCEIGLKINGRKMSNVSTPCIKASSDTPTLSNSTSSVWCSPPKQDRLDSKESEKNNSSNTASVFTLTGSKSNLTDVSYENIQVGPPLSSSPSSVKIEKELNYASLDLPPTADGEVPRTVKLGNGVSSGYQTNKTNESGVEEAGTSTLSYAEIDFTKSEGLRNVSGSLREGRV